MKKLGITIGTICAASFLSACNAEQRAKDYCSEGPECYEHICKERGVKTGCESLEKYCELYKDDEYCLTRKLKNRG